MLIYWLLKGLLMSTFFSLYFGILSSVAPTLIWLMILRSMVGFGVGGAAQAFTSKSFIYKFVLDHLTIYLCFIFIIKCFLSFRPRMIVPNVQHFWVFSGPSEHVWKCAFFFPLIALLERVQNLILIIQLKVVLAIFIMPTLGWRYLLGFTSIPLAVFGIFCFFLPESARYYQASGQNDNALKVLERVARENKGTLPEGKLISPKRVNWFWSWEEYTVWLEILLIWCNIYVKANTKVARMSDLFSKEHRFHTIYLWIIWFSCTFSYYGIVLLTTELLNMGGVCSGRFDLNKDFLSTFFSIIFFLKKIP